MTEDEIKSAPLPSVRRLPVYLRLLYELKAGGQESVSCPLIADELGLVSVQVRKDLAITGIVGKPKVGYQTSELISAIESFLGWNNTRDAFLVGVGSLGTALLGYEGFGASNLNIVAGFDNNPKKVGKIIHGKKVMPMEKFTNLVRRMHILIGILTVPAPAAQGIADVMIGAGIRAIWNYTPGSLRVPDSVIVEDVRLASSLAALSSRLAEVLRKEPVKRADLLPPTAKEAVRWTKNKKK